ncbi:MAG: T9SS type A sorting domain-containing protein [Bacteroidales bacterium]|nr:T9SS type A sorting domain-containing protein [Bacteroidales bacterium]MCF8351696.1 T9SS type A sorting domain-containing protein [Bacteroidales bacterium]MCF8375370.1 T9SS type A sorting domain-containing protein [Bacteroidales bacterium]
MKTRIYPFLSAFAALFLSLAMISVQAQDPPEITLIQPNDAGIEIEVGSDYLISWTDNFSQPVKILYSTDDGASFTDMPGASSVTGSTWSWSTTGFSTGTNYRIRVKSSVNSTYGAESENSFSLVTTVDPEIEVIYPSEAGIVWAPGTTHLISWTDNLNVPVTIQIRKFDPMVTTEIATDVEGTTYEWTVPSDFPEFDNYKILVRGAGVYGASEEYFEIGSTAAYEISEIFQPKGGEEWVPGTDHLISWQDNFSGSVDIYLYKGGAEDSEIQMGVTGSTYSWSIPSGLDLATDYTVMIFKSDNHDVYLESAQFEITNQPSNGEIYEVLQPDGGENWLRGTSHLISWRDNLTGNVDIEIYKGATLKTTLSDITGSTTTWDIPDDEVNYPNGSDYKVKVVSVDDDDIYAWGGTFSISASLGGSITVLQPSIDGLIWQRGQTYLISWTDDLVEPVDIRLKNSETNEIDLIAEGVEGSTYEWTIDEAQELGDKFLIGIRSSEDYGIQDFSEFYFDIVNHTPGGQIYEVFQPEAGDEWLLNSTYLISWNDNLTENVNIDLVDYDGAPDIIPIATEVGESTYSWTIDDDDFDLGDNYTVRISSVLNSGIKKESGTFSIILTSGDIDLEAPNGGESWTIGNNYWITWTDNLTENVEIDLYKNDAYFDDIADDVEGSTYVWNTTGLTAADDYKVKVFSTLDEDISDISDDVFSLVDPVNIAVYPNPANSYVTITLNGLSEGDYELSLFNQYNIEVLSTSFNISTGNAYRLSTAGLPDGVYFLTLTNSESRISKKIVVQH